MLNSPKQHGNEGLHYEGNSNFRCAELENPKKLGGNGA